MSEQDGALAPASKKKKLDDSVVAQLKRLHGDDLKSVSFGKGEGAVIIVVRTPTTDEYDRFTDRAAEGAGKRMDALKELGAACAVYPDEKTREAFFARKPAVTTTLGGYALELAGISEDDTEKL